MRQTLYLSVGHTAHSTYNTGIQRVTRAIAREVTRTYISTHLLEWNLERRRYILLDNNARAKLAKHHGPPYQAAETRISELLKSLETINVAELRDETHPELKDLIDHIHAEEAGLKEYVDQVLREVRAEQTKLLKLGQASGLGFARFTFEAELPAATPPDKILRSEALIREATAIVQAFDRSRILALPWVAWLPLPRAGRTAVRRTVRYLNNLWINRADRKKIAKVSGMVVRGRRQIDRRKQRIEKLLAQVAPTLLVAANEHRGVRNHPILRELTMLGEQLSPREFKPQVGAWVVVPELMTASQMWDVIAYVRSHGLRLAVVVHDAIPISHPQWVNTIIRENHAGYLRAAAEADCVIPVSQFSGASFAAFIKDCKLPLPRIAVCPNGVNLPRHPPLPAPPPHDGRIRCLYVATLEPRKNHRGLLTAWSILREQHPDLPLELTLVGNAYDGFADIAAEVEAAVAVDPQLHWPRQVDDQMLESLYQRSDFTVFASVVEGFGLPILESLGHGRPCLCANFGAMAEVAPGGGCHLVDVSRPEVLAAGLHTMATDHDLRTRLTKEAELRTMRTWSDYAQDLLQVLGLSPGTQPIAVR